MSLIACLMILINHAGETLTETLPITFVDQHSKSKVLHKTNYKRRPIPNLVCLMQSSIRMVQVPFINQKSEMSLIHIIGDIICNYQ